MGRTAAEVKDIVARYVAVLEPKIAVERILLTNVRDPGEEESDLQLLVISPNFEEMDLIERSDLVSLATLEVTEPITAWAFSSQEFADVIEGRSGHGLLGMALHGSREVYHQGPAAVASRGKRK